MSERHSPIVAFWFLLAASPLAADPAVGTPVNPLPLFPDPRAVSYRKGWAIPLSGARPGWYTADLSREVIGAAGLPVAAPAGTPLPGEVGIRPGARMVEPHGCTMNFVFTRDGGFLIGTAGHCVDEVGQQVVLLTLAPGSEEPVLVDIGTVVAFRNGGVGDDWALVAIRPELSGWVNATTAVLGGPCGAYSGSGPELLVHYGHGLAVGSGGTPRAGLALRWEEDHFGWASPTISGDSGSPVLVLSDLAAAGNLTHLVVDALWLPEFVAGTRIQVILGALEGLQLATSERCDGLPVGGKQFIRGDANGDLALDISDPVKTLFFLFARSGALECQDPADADDSGTLEVSDAIVIFSYLFQAGPAPPPPFPEPGPDPTPDALPPCS